VLANPPENHAAIYWEHDLGKKSIRIVYDKNTSEVLGFNLMGVRYRHEVCEKWLREKTSVETVLQDLSLANFDPEFYDEYETSVISIYNKQSGKSLQKMKKRSWNTVLNFLRS
jgi:hypothetical protein